VWRRRTFLVRRFFRGLIFQRFLFGAATVLVFGGIAYKIHSDDVARIEKAAGKRAENLTEPELLSAMKNLGIRKLEITSEENEEIRDQKPNKPPHRVAVDVPV
jgi:hypothetical protein